MTDALSTVSETNNHQYINLLSEDIIILSKLPGLPTDLIKLDIVTSSDKTPIGTPSPVGNNFNFTENIIINKIPIQNVGVDINT